MFSKSFRLEDQAKTKPIEDFLATFASSGLECTTAEAAEAECISEKVRHKIDDCALFVGIITRRRALLGASNSIIDRLRCVFGKVSEWSAPPWILQECGYALKGGKTLVLFREEGVELGGLQSDLEFITYDPNSPATALTKASAVLNGLVSRHLGITVERTLELRPLEPIRAAESIVPAATPVPSTREVERDGLEMEFGELLEAVRADDWTRAEAAYERGRLHAAEGGEERELLWAVFYHSLGAKAGRRSSMAALLSLAAVTPKHPAVLEGLGKGYAALSENRKAADSFLQAAECEGDVPLRGYYLLRAGECFERVAEYEQGIRAFEACVALDGDERVRALNGVSRILSIQGKHVAANAVAEYSLSEDPTQMDVRFSLGLGYGKQGAKGLYLYHFAILSEQDGANGPATYNLAIGYHELEMPITAFANYNRALERGETLSASAMSDLLMEAGDAERAEELLRQALTKADFDPGVGRALFDVRARKLKEEEKSRNVRRNAEKTRPQFVRYGAARLLGTLPDISGVWVFPFAELTLRQDGSAISGTGEDEAVATGLSNLSALAALARCAYTLVGTVSHMSAEISITTTAQTKREGFITFEASALSGHVTELSGGEVVKTYKITRKARTPL